MRPIFHLIAALAVLSFASPAFAAAGGPYKLDAKGKCHDAKGGFAAAAKCKPPAAAGKCRDVKTKKYVKCGTPGSEAVPAKK